MKKRIFLSVLFLTLSLAACISCALPPPTSGIPGQTFAARRCILVTDGVVIEAVDESFRFESGIVYDTPFASHTRNINFHLPDVTIAPYYGEALEQMGAKPVIIHYPGRDKPIYGVLLISYLFPDAQGLVVSSYRIEIPVEAVKRLQGANVVAVFENYDVANPSRYMYQNKTLKPKNWILWLSEIPLW